MKKKSLARGVLFMTLSNLVVKAAGLVFKIPLTAMIGEEGMGYYSGAYTLFTWLYMLSAAGLPAASSMLISRLDKSRRSSGAIKILKVSLVLFVPIGLLGSALLILGAGPIAALMKIEKSRLSIIAIAPTLFFICQSAALRGYFQGFSEFGWHALSQIAEALGKAALGVALARRALMLGSSVSQAAGAAAFGITVGVFLGMVVLYFAMIFKRREVGLPCEKKSTSIAAQIMSAALPITLSSSVMSLTNLIDTFIMTRSLHLIGFSQAETAAIYGNYTSLAVPMFNLPPVLCAPIAVALLPTLSKAIASSDFKRAGELARTATIVTLIIAIPCSLGLSAFSKPILSMLFEDEVAARGAMSLTLLAPSSAILCLIGVTNTVLQASSRERIPLYAMLGGAVVKLVGTYTLTPIFEKHAAPISTLLCYLTVLVISCMAIAVYTPLCEFIKFRDFSKVTLLAALSVCFAAIVYPSFSTNFAVIGAIVIAGASYLILMLLFEREVITGFIKK